MRAVGYFNQGSRLPDQPTKAVDPEVERLARVLIDGLIAKLSEEPAAPAASLMDALADQLHQAANLRRLGVIQRATNQPARPRSQEPGRTPAGPE